MSKPNGRELDKSSGGVIGGAPREWRTALESGFGDAL
jgi:hypothetical protein